MEVASENSVNEIPLKALPESKTGEDFSGKVNGDLNGGVSDSEMEVNNSGNEDEGCENGTSQLEENGIEPMDTDCGDDVTNNDVASDNNLVSGDVSDNTVRTSENDNGCDSVVNDDPEVCGTVADPLDKLPESDNDDATKTTSECERVASAKTDKPNQEASMKDSAADSGNNDSADNASLDEDDEATQDSKELLDKPDGEQTPDSSTDEKKSLSEEPTNLVKNDSEKGKSSSVDTVSISLLTPSKDSGEDDSCVEITPEKSSKKKKSVPITNVTPRRSSRNLNKTKSYADDEVVKSEDDDVQEVPTMEPVKKNTIVVSDTKRLAEIAAVSKNNKSGKKEPTLVIIDTNSLLANKTNLTQAAITQQVTITAPQGRPWPVAVTQNALFHGKSSVKVTAIPQQSVLPQAPPPAPPQPKPIILPSLTDDMYVVEAPSFIVPYVYEKPPVNALKEFVRDLDKTIREQEAEQERKQKEEEEEKKAEKAKADEKEKSEKDNDESMDVDKTPDKPTDKEKNEESKESTDEKVEKDEDNEAKKEPAKEETKPDKAEGDDVKVVGETKKDDNDVLEDRTNSKKSDNYFENPLGKFFMQIGINLVQEHVQQDLLRNQLRKKERDGKNCPPEVHMAISSLQKTLESSKENNEPFKFEVKKCSLCSFKTESQLVLAHHLETPHTRNFVYRCNFCDVEVRSPHDILFHMEAEHNVRGRLERTPAFHQCPNCPFEDNQKGKLSRHLLSCAKKYKPERNQEPPLEWEPPAKIPRVRGVRGLPTGNVMYPTNPIGVRGAGLACPSPVLQRLPPAAAAALSAAGGATATVLPVSSSQRARGRPPIYVQRYPKTLAQHIRSGMVFRPSITSNSQPPVLLPAPYQISSSQQLLQVDRDQAVPLYLGTNYANTTPSSLQATSKSSVSNGAAVAAAGGSGAAAKLLQQPSISITPLPRGGSTPATTGVAPPGAKPGRPPGANSNRNTFVICEICDGYIKDLEQLRNHMQWIHKVKIHPKMIYNRPPLNCQKCQFRFFTDQGLERHLLGSHGLVTSSMQEAANKGKDGGRCPVCGRVYQWKLLNHVARDHNLSLKPAHLSYKCTVCTATFGMYKQFENHVYSAHSVVAKRVIDKKTPATPPQPSTSSTTTSQVPLKINDEITIIPQPARNKLKPTPSPVTAGGATVTKTSK